MVHRQSNTCRSAQILAGEAGASPAIACYENNLRFAGKVIMVHSPTNVTPPNKPFFLESEDPGER